MVPVGTHRDKTTIRLMSGDVSVNHLQTQFQTSMGRDEHKTKREPATVRKGAHKSVRPMTTLSLPAVRGDHTRIGSLALDCLGSEPIAMHTREYRSLTPREQKRVPVYCAIVRISVASKPDAADVDKCIGYYRDRRVRPFALHVARAQHGRKAADTLQAFFDIY